MIIEGMVAVGVGFTALCGVSASGQFDKIAEENGWQEKGELEKWQNKNVFNISDLLDVNDFIEDLREEVGLAPTPQAAEENPEAKEKDSEEQQSKDATTESAAA